MSAAENLPASNRTRGILEELEAVRENLLALSDDIWLSIDHNDSEALEEGVQFKRAYNEKMTEFDRLATELSNMIQQHTRVNLAAEEQTGLNNIERNERIIEELNREEPHSIDENFTYKRPHGFILDGRAATGVTTWKRLFELICQQLLRRDPDRFHALPDTSDFISSRGHHSFTRNPEELRSAGLIGDGIYAEINLSANMIRDTVRRLLNTFEIPTDELQIFLREDRDAERSREADNAESTEERQAR